MRLLTDSRRGAVRHDSASGEWQPATMYLAWFDAGPEDSGSSPSPWESWDRPLFSDEAEVLHDLGLDVDVFASWESEAAAADVARREARSRLARALRARELLLALQAKLEAT